jgi:ribosome biogenesis protein ENP2
MMDPFAYERYRQERVAKKLEEQRQSRIGLTKRLPKVNAAAAAKLLAKQAEGETEEGGAARAKWVHGGAGCGR